MAFIIYAWVTCKGTMDMVKNRITLYAYNDSVVMSRLHGNTEESRKQLTDLIEYWTVKSIEKQMSVAISLFSQYGYASSLLTVTIDCGNVTLSSRHGHLFNEYTRPATAIERKALRNKYTFKGATK